MYIEKELLLKLKKLFYTICPRLENYKASPPINIKSILVVFLVGLLIFLILILHILQI